MIIRLSWKKLPFRFSQYWFLLKLLALKRCTFQGLNLTYEILENIISNFIAGIYYISWELLDHMFSFLKSLNLNKMQLFFDILGKIAFLPITSSMLAHSQFWDRFWDSKSQALPEKILDIVNNIFWARNDPVIFTHFLCAHGQWFLSQERPCKFHTLFVRARRN